MAPVSTHAGPKEQPLENVLFCPMPGLVVTILVQTGDRVFRGQDLVSIESMKMESFVASPCDGVVDRVLVQPGKAVESGEVLPSKLSLPAAKHPNLLPLIRPRTPHARHALLKTITRILNKSELPETGSSYFTQAEYSVKRDFFLL